MMGRDSIMRSLAHLVILSGLVLAGPVQCGFSANILTMTSTDSGEDTETKTEDPVTVADTSSFSESTDGERDIDTDSASEHTDSASEHIDSASEDCEHGATAPNEVLLIGDSWIFLSESRIGELARSAGKLGDGEDYAYRAMSGATIEAIVQQYNSYVASGDTPVKVVIMNGGAVDTYATQGDDTSVDHVVETFSLFLGQLADESEGPAEHVIYALYSEESSIPGIEALRPRMQAVCAESAVPCHFVDLQSVWEGNPGYTSPDTINPSSDGADAIAETIWQTMQNNCIAQ